MSIENENNKIIYLPKNLISYKGMEGISMLEKYGDKITSILINLDYYKSTNNITRFTLDDLITDCGYDPRKGTNGSRNLFKSILKDMQNDGLLISDDDLSKIKPSKMTTAKVNFIDTDEKGHYRNCFTIKFKNYRKIMDLECRSDKKDNLIKTYCAIAKMISWDVKNNRPYKNGFVTISRESLKKRINVSNDTFDNSLKELRRLGLIKYNNIGYVIKNDKCRLASNVYAFTDKDLELGLKESEKYFKKNGYKFETNANKNKKLNKILGIEEVEPKATEEVDADEFNNEFLGQLDEYYKRCEEQEREIKKQISDVSQFLD